MSVEVKIVQKGLFGKKKLGKELLNTVVNKLKISYGVKGDNFKTMEYNESMNSYDVGYCLYNKSQLGIGIALWFSHNHYDCYIGMGSPATVADINMFYDIVAEVCNQIGSDVYEIGNNRNLKVTDIPNHKSGLIDLNIELIRKIFHEQKDTTVVGAIYPIVIENEQIEKWLLLDKDALSKDYAEYLHDKQKDEYDYPNPEIFMNKSINKYCGMHQVIAGDKTIVPLVCKVPIHYKNEIKEIAEWKIGIYEKTGEEYQMVAFMYYDIFAKEYELSSRPRFDEDYVIIEITEKEVEQLKKVSEEI